MTSPTGLEVDPDLPDVPAIRMQGITKSFGANDVLHGVDFEVRRGEVHALVGGNGAGKSTLMKILQGVHHCDAGSIEVYGAPLVIESIHEARAAGIGMVFQEFSLIPTLSVAKNIFLGAERHGVVGLLNDRDSVIRAREIFERMGVDIDPRTEVGNLPTAYWQLTEIAKAVAQDARVLILDEPTASLAKGEVDALFDLVRRLAADGMSVIYISHRMDEIFEIADRITVLRDGNTVLTGDRDQLDGETIIHAIVGRTVEGHFEWRPRSVDRTGPPLLSVEGINAGRRVRDVSFTAHPGEIIGLAGLMGSGRTELARCLFGIDPIESGTVRIRAQEIALDGPKAAIDAGIALVPEDRRSQGLVLSHSVQENLLLTLLGGLRRGPLLDRSQMRRRAAELIEEMDVVAASADLPINRLSGGNQQKIVIGKWLATDPDVLILDEPTAGIDIGTKVEIVERIRTLADAGKVVIIISSELPELLAVADRIFILRDGSIEQDLDRSEVPDEHALQLAVQGVAS